MLETLSIKGIPILLDTGGRGRTDTPEEHDFESCGNWNFLNPLCTKGLTRFINNPIIRLVLFGIINESGS